MSAKLVGAEVVRVLRNLSVAALQAAVDRGEFVQVFDLSAAPGTRRRRHLRFALAEIQTPRRLLEPVLLPVKRPQDLVRELIAVNREHLRSSEVCDWLSMDSGQLRRLCETGPIQSRIDGKTRIVSNQSLQAFLVSRLLA